MLASLHAHNMIYLSSIRPDQKNQSSLRGRAHAVYESGRAICGWDKPGRKALPGWPEDRRCAKCENCIKMLGIDVGVIVDHIIVRPSGREYQVERLLAGQHDYQQGFTGTVRYELPTDPDDCWLWLSGTSLGYPYIGVRNGGSMIRYRAHRWFYERYVGDLEDGTHIHHRCENKMCVNPVHLLMVSPADHGQLHVGRVMNLSSQERLRRSLVMRGESSPTSKLTENDVITMRDNRITGMTLLELAHKYDCSQSMVSNIVNGRAWKHLLPKEVTLT